jgi:hypothetical protein
MSNPMIRIHNVETDEIIDREMTDVEFSDYQKSLLPKPLTKEETESAAKKAVAEAKLAALGLTSDDLKALGLGGN